MLVGSLEIEVGRAAEFGMSIHHRDVAGTRVDPDVEGVAALRRAFRKAEELGEFDVGFFEPNVGAFFLDEIGNLLGQFGGDDGTAVFVKEDRKRHTPGALTGDTPVGTGLDRAVDAVAAPLGQPLDLIDFAQGFFSELVDGDEELLDRAEDDGGLGTPAMWVAVLVGFFAEQCAFFLEEFNDGGVRFEDVDTNEVGQAAFVGELSVVVDRAENFEPILLADYVVVRTVTGSDVHRAGSGFGGDEGSKDDFGSAIEERMLGLMAFELGAFDLAEFFFKGEAGLLLEVGEEITGYDDCFAIGVFANGVDEALVHGDAEVGGKGPRSGGPDRDAGAAGNGIGRVGEVEIDEDRGRLLVLIFHFGFRESGLGTVGPLDRFLRLIDAAFLDERREGADDIGLVVGVESEVRIVPITKDAEAFERVALGIDPSASEGFAAAADFGGLDVAGIVALHHLEFDGQPVAIPTRDIGRFEARHGFGFHHEVLENLVQASAHVDVAIGKGRAVMEDEARGAFGLTLGDNSGIETFRIPLFESSRLPDRQVSLHGEICLGQEQGVFVGFTFWSAHSARGGTLGREGEKVKDGGIRPHAEPRRCIVAT